MIDIVNIKEVKLLLGKLCKQQRQKRRISQEELASALGMSRFTIQKFEAGKNATLDTVLKIANHFDLLNQVFQSIKEYETTNDIKSLY